MIDPRIKLKQELKKLGVEDYNAILISLDAGSSQCIVNKEYLEDIKINKENFKNVYKKVLDFYSGEMNN